MNPINSGAVLLSHPPARTFPESDHGITRRERRQRSMDDHALRMPLIRLSLGTYLREILVPNLLHQ
jgi:hypothetical protein